MTRKKKGAKPMTSNLNLSAAELLVIQMLRAGQSPISSQRPEIEPPVQHQKRDPKAKVARHWHTDVKTCPRCSASGPVLADFGVVVKRGVERAQSWCKACRASVSYYGLRRKNTRRDPTADH